MDARTADRSRMFVHKEIESSLSQSEYTGTQTEDGRGNDDAAAMTRDERRRAGFVAALWLASRLFRGGRFVSPRLGSVRWRVLSFVV